MCSVAFRYFSGERGEAASWIMFRDNHFECKQSWGEVGTKRLNGNRKKNTIKHLKNVNNPCTPRVRKPLTGFGLE